jgi:hypothetical protein
VADHALSPPDPGSHQKRILAWNRFQHFAKRGSKPVGNEPAYFLQYGVNILGAQGESPELGEQFPLAQADLQLPFGVFRSHFDLPIRASETPKGGVGPAIQARKRRFLRQPRCYRACARNAVSTE